MSSNRQVDSWGNPPASHVPSELIRSIEWFDSPEMRRDPYHLAKLLRDEPPLIYNLNNPYKGRSWFPTRASLCREILADTARFSSQHTAGLAAAIGENWLLGAVEMDPPQHPKFREIMAQWVSPVEVARLKEKVDQRAREMVTALVDRGGCEFVASYAMPYPVTIFLELLGLPLEQTNTFVTWMHEMIHATDLDVRMAATRAAVKYFRALNEDRRAHPRDDLVTRVVQSKIDGKVLSEDEALGISMVLMLGGLDTVVNSLAFHFHYLAKDQDLQQRLRKNLDDIPKAVNELLRAFPPATSQRMAKMDTEVGGVSIKKGDWFTIVYGVANRDPREFAHPDTIDIDRADNRHMTFSFGPHFCIGIHLALRELHTSYREWLTRVPPFRLVDPSAVETHGGLTFGIKRLELTWS